LLKNHHAFESKVQEVQEAQANQVARERPDGLRMVLRTALQAARAPKDHAAKDADLKAALQAKDHGAKDADLKVALRAKDHAARDAGLKAVRRTALQEALALKDQAEEDQAEEAQAEKDPAEKECGVRIPNDSSSGPWNSIVMAMASSIATS
jgi:hypothetical protein